MLEIGEEEFIDISSNVSKGLGKLKQQFQATNLGYRVASNSFNDKKIP